MVKIYQDAECQAIPSIISPEKPENPKLDPFHQIKIEPKLGKLIDYDQNPISFEGTHNTSGPRLNIKTVLSTYDDFHVKDKTAVRTSYL